MISRSNNTAGALGHPENAVRAFVFQFFALYDARVPVSDILPRLVEEGLEMKFPDFPAISNHAC